MTNIDPAIKFAVRHPRCECGHGAEIHDTSHGCDETVIHKGLARCCPCFHREDSVRLIAVAAAVDAARAEAWDEGYATCLGDFDIAARREARSPNPHKATP